MSNDTFTTTTSRSWFSRIGSAIGGILFGVILFFGSFVLLTWNEGRAIKREKTLQFGAGQVVPVTADEVVAANQGKLVHFSGTAVAADPVSDPVFGIVADALKLRRDVEMYQWDQSEKSTTKQKLGGGEETTTTYSYSKKWSSSLIDSSRFQVPQGHENPTEMPVSSETFVAGGIHVGAFQLSPGLVSMINNFTPRPVTNEEAAAASGQHSTSMAATTGGVLTIGKDPAAPAIGDLRITYRQAVSGPVSVIAAQVGDTLEPFIVRNLGSIEILKVGTLSADAMFQQEQEGNVLLTWILRLVGFVMMLVGISLITNVISVVASVIPFLGNLVSAGTGLLGLAVALPLTLTTIALAWLAYRPLIGIPLLLAAGALVVFAGSKLWKARKKPGTPPALTENVSNDPPN